MKCFRTSLILAAIILEGTAVRGESPPPIHFVVVLARGLPEATRLNVEAAISSKLETLPNNTRLSVFVGEEHRLLGDVVIEGPPGKDRLRQTSLRVLADSVFTFFDKEIEGSQQIGIVRLPRTAISVAGNLPEPSRKMRAIVIGDPIYHSERPGDASWSIKGSRVPSDAVAFDRKRSPFYDPSCGQIPGGTEVVFVTPIAWGNSQRHRELIIRFYRNLITNSGGTLIRVTPSLTLAMQAELASQFGPPIKPPSPGGFFGVVELQNDATKQQLTSLRIR